MGITLRANRYGKAEVRLLWVARHADHHADHHAGQREDQREDQRAVPGGGRHEVKDLNVSVTLSGDLDGAYLAGDNRNVLPTDSQRNTVYAFAREYGVGEIEEFGLRLARHFVDSQPPIRRARVNIEEYRWDRVPVTGHSFVRSGGEVRTAQVTCDGGGAWAVSGLRDLVLLNTTGSEFRGYATDRYTTLAETADRILATAVTARWRHAAPDGDWATSYAGVRRLLVDAFAGTYSRSLQETLYAMGRRVLEGCSEIAEIRLILPNRHHLPVDLGPFGLDNEGEVFHVADRPYGLIEGELVRDGAPPPGSAW